MTETRASAETWAADRRARGVGTPADWAAGATALLAAWLACGTVSPTVAGSSERIAFLSGSVEAWAAVLAVTAASAWLARRRRTAPLWLLSISLMAWLPLPATGSVLLWHGPAAAVLFGIVSLLVLWPTIAGVAQRVVTRSVRQQAALAFAIAATLYAAAAWRMQPQIPGGDEPHYLVITQSLLLDRDLRIENNHRRGDYTAYTTQILEPDFLKRGRDGQIYSIHAPGTSVLVLPAFALGGYPAVVGWLALLAALGSVLLWDTARRVTGSASAAWVGWAATALSAPFFFHAFTVYPDGPGAVIVMLLVSALAMPERLRTPTRSALLGAAAAWLPWLHTRYTILAGITGLLILARLAQGDDKRWMRAGAFVAVPTVSLAGWLWFFYSIYGTVDPSVPYGGYTQSAIGNVPRGLTGLLLDQQFGLIPNAPVFIAALGGLAALWRRRRRFTAELSLIVVPYAVAVACYHMWWGGRSAPARFLVPVLLPLGVPVAAWWRDAGRTGRSLMGTSVLASVALALGLAWIDRGSLVYNVRDGYALWADALVPLARWPLALPSLFRAGPGAAWIVAAVWAAWIGGAVAALRWSAHRPAAPSEPESRDGDRWRAIVAAACCAIVTGASATTWALTRADSIQAGAGLLGVLRAAEASPGRGWRATHPLGTIASTALATTIELPTSGRGEFPGTPLWVGRDVPAGRYELRSTSGLRVSGHVDVVFGRDDVPLASATWRDIPPGVLPLSIELPAGAKRLRVVADQAASQTIGALRLRLVARSMRDAAPARYASARLRAPGGATAWLLDGNAFVEPAGFWVRGGADTTVVVDGGGRSAELVLAAGPVATVCEVALAGSETTRVTLGPGGSEVIEVPAGPIAVRVGSRGGFRPREHDPRSPDARWLGVRVELR